MRSILLLALTLTFLSQLIISFARFIATPTIPIAEASSHSIAIHHAHNSILHAPLAAQSITGRPLVQAQNPLTLNPVQGATTLGPLTAVDGMPLNGVSANPRLSADGSVIVFASRATNILDSESFDPRFDFWQIYAYDRTQDQLTRISVSPTGQAANGSAGGSPPAVSADGNRIAFTAQASNLVFGDTNGVADVFVYDRNAQHMQRVSVASNGAQANRAAYLPAISADGTVAAFVAQATNLVAGDTNQVPDVFVHTLSTGQTMRVSVASDGTQANGSSGLSAPALSADGRYVAFASAATNLVANDTNGASDIFVHDRQTGQTARVSVTSQGQQADGASTAPAISADGRYVAFLSSASNLGSGNPQGHTHVYLHDRQTGSTIRISTAHDGAPGNGHSFAPALSADGRFVAFASTAANLVPNDTNNSIDIFLHDGLSGTIERVSVTASQGESNGLSWRPTLGGNGRYVMFESNATNLTATSGDTGGATGLYLRDRGDRATGTYTLAGEIRTATGTPVADLTVQVGERFPRFVMTDATGNFVADNLPAGDYSIRIPAAQGPDTEWLMHPALPMTVSIGEDENAPLRWTAYPCRAPSGLNLCDLRPGDILLALEPQAPGWPQLGGTYFTRAALYAGMVESPEATTGPQTAAALRAPHVIGVWPAADDQDRDYEIGLRGLLDTPFWTGDSALDWAVVRPQVNDEGARRAVALAQSRLAESAPLYALYGEDGTTPVAQDDPQRAYAGALIAQAYARAGHTLVPTQRPTPAGVAAWITPDDLYWHASQIQRQPQPANTRPLLVWAEGPVHLAAVNEGGARLGYTPLRADEPSHHYGGTDGRVVTLAVPHLDITTAWEVELTGQSGISGAQSFVLGWREMTPTGTVTFNGGVVRAREVRTWPLVEFERTGTQIFLPLITR